MHFRLTGLEYKFVSEVTEHWNVTYAFEDKKWVAAFDILSNRTSDMFMCSVWLTESHIKKFDLTHYFDQQCLTMMVPRQKHFNEVAALYAALEPEVWILFTVSFVVVVVLLTAISRFGHRIKMYESHGLPYRDAIKSFTEITNLTTTHGVSSFPTQTPIKITITTWLIFSLFFGLWYSSGYTSLLTSPPSSRAINTIQDFTEHKLSWGEIEDVQNMKCFLRRYNDTYFTALANSAVEEKSEQERIQNIESGKFGYMVTTFYDRFISNVPLKETSKLVPLRTMQSCVIKFFTGFAFPKNSPYTEYFSSKLSK